MGAVAPSELPVQKSKKGERPKSEPERVELVGRLCEFRDALDAEIEAAHSATKSSAIQLIGGQRIERRGEFFQYTFKLETPQLGLPDDLPGDLYIYGRDERVDATVVSMAGLTLVLSVREDLGANIPRASLSSNLTNLLKVLITRIETHATEKRLNPSGDRLLGDTSVSGEPASVADLGRLNEDQVHAVASGLGRDCTFILGPPGTGKTATIGTLGQQLVAADRSLLLVSHTNTAVDQALVHIAKAMTPEALADGKVLRLGQPVDERVKVWDDLLVETHVDRRSEGLHTRRRELIDEKSAITRRLLEIERLFHVVGFASRLGTAIPRLQEREAELSALISAIAVLAERIEAQSEQNEQWVTKKEAAQAALTSLSERDGLIGRLAAARENLRRVPELAEQRVKDAEQSAAELKSQTSEQATKRVDSAQAGLRRCRTDKETADEQLDRAVQVARQVERFDHLPGLSFCQSEVSRLQAQLAELTSTIDEKTEELAVAQQTLAATGAANGLTRRMRRLPEPEAQHAVVDELLTTVDEAKRRREISSREVEAARQQLAEVTHLKEELDRWRDHPTVEQSRELLAEVDRRLAAAVSAADDAEMLRTTEVAAAETEATRLIAEAEADAAQLPTIKRQAVVDTEQAHHAAQAVMDEFETIYGADPAVLLAEANRFISELEDLRRQLVNWQERRVDHHAALEANLDDFLRDARRYGLIEPEEEPDEDMSRLLVLLAASCDAAEQIAASVNELELNAEMAELKGRLPAIDAEVHRIDEELQQVLAAVIGNATVIATTLTRAYLRDEIQERVFDTVILDEASMAPIPALWVAAGVATSNVVLVGDPHQLPPIALAADESKPKLPATKWLGRDVFHAARVVDDESSAKNAPEHLVALRTQYRMHPAISAAPNDLVYDGLLRDGPNTADEAGLDGWYDLDWGHDDPLVMVDMESADAWCTSVSSGGRSSRLNFLSATVSVDLAERLLKEDRHPPNAGHARILIATPYRPQAKLIGMLLHDQGIDGEVVAGTVHGFQGSEAPVVIYDLVLDDPHRLAGLFDPRRDPGNSRLFNVALTRAQHRLFVVGDFKHLMACGKKAFLGQVLTHLTPRARVVDAHDVVPRGLFARAARAETRVRGEEETPKAGRRIVSQEDFDRFFLADVDNAVEQIVLYSPFVTSNRLSIVGPHLRAAYERGVEIAVFTKALDDRSKSERATYADLQRTLAQWGVKVVSKKAMHEKVCFFDSDVVWTGSLNPLSFRSTQEIMERRDSGRIAAEYRMKLQVDDALAAFAAGQERCPFCQSELAVGEGKDGLYLRCVVPRCYARGLKDPPLRDGKMACRCGGELYFGKWGPNDAWRCHESHHHHLGVHRNHLRLDAMRALIPAKDLKRLDKVFATGPTPSKRTKPSSNGSSRSNGDPAPETAEARSEVGQTLLFDD